MEIKVIKDVAIDMEKMSAEDREALFNRIRQINPQLSISTMRSLANMMSEHISDEIKYSKPQIMELLLRKVVQLGICGDIINMLVVPIIAFKQQAKKGGAKGFMRKQKEALEDVPGAIKVRFDNRTLCSTHTYDYIAPTNEEISIIGLTVNESCDGAMISTDKLVPLTSFSLPSSDNSMRVKLGNFKATGDIFKLPAPSLEIGGLHRSNFVLTATDEKFEGALSDVYNFLYKFHRYSQMSDPWVLSQYDYAMRNVSNNTDASKYATDTLIDALKWVYTPRGEDKIDPDPPLGEIETLIGDASGVTISTKYRTNLLNDLYIMDLASAYYRAQILGPRDTSVEQSLSSYKNRMRREEARRELEKDIADKRNRENMYRAITERKFPQRYKKIMPTRGNILDLLDQTERKQVMAEYDRREQYYNAVVNNKCPHVALYRQLRAEPRMDKQRQYFDKLMDYFSKDAKGMIKCSACKYDIMCEHVKIQYQMEFADKRLSDISAALSKYTADAAPGEPYFCKICGEVFSTGLFEVAAAGTYENSIPEELRNLMYSEIIGDLRYVKFSDIVNVQALVNTIRSSIYPFISDIEKQILKSRTISADEIKAKKKLFISLYSFAYLIHLVTSSKDKNITFKNLKPGTGLAEVIKHVIGIVINSKNILIRAVPGVTNDIIKNKLIEAYKALSMKGPMTVLYASDTENIITTALLDPVYGYIFKMNQLAGIINNGKAKIGLDPATQLEKILGMSVKQLESADDIFGSVVISKFKNNTMSGFDKLSIDKLYSQLDTNIKDVYGGYAVKSFELWYGATESRKEPYYISDGVAKYVSEYNSQYEKFSSSEKVLVRIMVLNTMKNVVCQSPKNTRLFVYEEVALGRGYDEDGNKHEWKIYITADGEELDAGALSKLLESGKPRPPIVDLGCSVCKIRRSEVGNLSDEKIHESLVAKSSIENFFRFYENRCPKEGLHEFDAEGKCSKCALSTKMQLNVQSKESLNYYRAYKQTYQQDKEVLSGRSALDFPIPVDLDIGADKYKDMFAKWAFNFDIVLELAEKIKINHRAILCLGAIEKVPYDDVLNGIYNPPETVSRYDTRIYILESLVRDFLQEYNQLRYYSRMAKPNPEISALMDSSGYNKHKSAELVSALIDVYDDHNAKFLYFKSVKKPREIVEYCIQKLCEMALKIYSDTNVPTDNIRKAFVKYIIDKFIRHDMLTTKHGHFNWGLLYPDQNKIDTETPDPNFTQNADEETITDDIDEDGGFGATNDAFKHTEDLDVDDIDVNDDDPSNQVRVEGYSLD